jgi:serine/threonine-protein kinase
MGLGLNDDDDDGSAPTSQKKRLLDPDDEKLIGRMLGEYRVDSVIGEGGMGIVFKGEQLLIKKTVAIKVLRRSLASDASFASRLLDEARVVNAIHHPQIINAFGFGQTDDGRPYIVMDFVQGEPLDERLTAKGRQSVLETLTMLNAILAPLEAAHASGVVHRDLKPSNVFVQKLPDGTDFPRLLDFGLAKHVDSQGAAGIAGTPAYMAPEHTRDGAVTPAIDLYAVGCLAYEMLAGRPPFEGPTVEAVLLQHLNANPKPLSGVRLDLGDEISDFVDELLAKDPAKRPSAGQARRNVARMMRAHAEATTVGEKRAPAPTAASAPELRTTPFTPLGVTPGDPQDAPTVMEVDHSRPRRPRKAKAAPVDPPTKPELTVVQPRRSWILPVVIATTLIVLAVMLGLILKA